MATTRKTHHHQTPPFSHVHSVNVQKATSSALLFPPAQACPPSLSASDAPPPVPKRGGRRQGRMGKGGPTRSAKTHNESAPGRNRSEGDRFSNFLHMETNKGHMNEDMKSTCFMENSCGIEQNQFDRDQPPSEQPNNRFLPGPRSIQGGSPPVPPARNLGNLPRRPMNNSEEAPPLPPDRKRQMPVSPPNLFISKPLLPHTEVETAPAPLIPLLKSSPLIPHTEVKTTPTTAYSSSSSVLHEVPPPVPKRGGRRSRSGPGRGACYGRISGHTSTSH